MKRPSSKVLFLTALTCATLTACGGGSSSADTDKTDTTVTTDTVTKATAANNTAAGATAISSDTTKLVYDLVADIGDTWQVTLDTSAKTFALKVIQSAYGLTDLTGTLAVGTSSGSRTTYTLSANGKDIGTLTTDSSTRSAAGNLTVGDKAASVSGSADKATELSKLAGTYNFVRFGRNVGSTLGSPDTGAGQALVSADGSTMTLCLNSTVGSDGKCVVIPGTGVTTPETATLKLTLDNNGHVVMKKEGAAFGVATLLPSNLGKALQMDMLSKNNENVWRTGVFYFAEAKAVGETAVNGQWTCAGLGADATSVSISGATGTAKNLSTSSVMNAVFKYNQVATSNNTFAAVNGFMSGGSTSDAVSDYDLFLPVSSSLIINQMAADNRVRVCRKTGD